MIAAIKRLTAAGVSNRKAASAAGVSVNTLRKYGGAANSSSASGRPA
jgi:hypothetical protein